MLFDCIIVIKVFILLYALCPMSANGSSEMRNNEITFDKGDFDMSQHDHSVGSSSSSSSFITAEVNGNRASTVNATPKIISVGSFGISGHTQSTVSVRSEKLF